MVCGPRPSDNFGAASARETSLSSIGTRLMPTLVRFIFLLWSVPPRWVYEGSSETIVIPGVLPAKSPDRLAPDNSHAASSRLAPARLPP